MGTVSVPALSTTVAAHPSMVRMRPSPRVWLNPVAHPSAPLTTTELLRRRCFPLVMAVLADRPLRFTDLISRLGIVQGQAGHAKSISGPLEFLRQPGLGVRRPDLSPSP